MKIALAADHGGFERKESIRSHLTEMGYDVQDFGCFSAESVDYPDYAFPAAEAVANGACEFGIVVCTTGVGVSICANKVRGVRCALCSDPEVAALSRRHNDANMLALGAKHVSEEQAMEIVRVWLETPHDGGRHARRVLKITEYERAKKREE